MLTIMSRHTLNDGITPDPRITNYTFHWHAFHLGPPTKIIGAYYRQEITWEEFSKSYLDYVSSDSLCKSTIELMIELSKYHDIEFVCIEETSEKCHRRLLAEWLNGRYRNLNIVIE